eukprot:UN23370
MIHIKNGSHTLRRSHKKKNINLAHRIYTCSTHSIIEQKFIIPNTSEYDTGLVKKELIRDDLTVRAYKTTHSIPTLKNVCVRQLLDRFCDMYNVVSGFKLGIMLNIKTLYRFFGHIILLNASHFMPLCLKNCEMYELEILESIYFLNRVGKPTTYDYINTLEIQEELKKAVDIMQKQKLKKFDLTAEVQKVKKKHHHSPKLHSNNHSNNKQEQLSNQLVHRPTSPATIPRPRRRPTRGAGSSQPAQHRHHGGTFKNHK